MPLFSSINKEAKSVLVGFLFVHLFCGLFGFVFWHLGVAVLDMAVPEGRVSCLQEWRVQPKPGLEPLRTWDGGGRSLVISTCHSQWYYLGGYFRLLDLPPLWHCLRRKFASLRFLSFRSVAWANCREVPFLLCFITSMVNVIGGLLKDEIIISVGKSLFLVSIKLVRECIGG